MRIDRQNDCTLRRRSLLSKFKSSTLRILLILLFLNLCLNPCFSLLSLLDELHDSLHTNDMGGVQDETSTIAQSHLLLSLLTSFCS